MSIGARCLVPTSDLRSTHFPVSGDAHSERRGDISDYHTKTYRESPFSLVKRSLCKSVTKSSCDGFNSIDYHVEGQDRLLDTSPQWTCRPLTIWTPRPLDISPQ